MKKLVVILFAAMLFLPSTARSQFLSFGVKAGLVSSSQNIDGLILLDDSEYDRKLGFSAAVFTEISFGLGFSISPQLEYAQRGIQMDIVRTTVENPDGNGEIVTLKGNLNYLIIPVYLKYSHDFVFGEAVLEAGPHYDILLENDADLFHDFYEEFDNSFGFSFGAAFAPKLALPVTPFIEFVYYMDIVKPLDKELSNPGYQGVKLAIDNNAFNINLGIKF